MKNNEDSAFTSLIILALLVLALSGDSNSDKPCTEKDNAEKPCKCTEKHCKNQQDFNKELLEKADSEKKCQRTEECLDTYEVKKIVQSLFEECTNCKIDLSIDGFMSISANGWLYTDFLVYNKKTEKSKGYIDKEKLKNIVSDQFVLLPNSKKEEMLKDINRCIKQLEEVYFDINKRMGILYTLRSIRDSLSQIK